MQTCWEPREQVLWLREEFRGAASARGEVRIETPPYRARRLAASQSEEALALVRAGQSPQRVADQLGVSYWVVLRLLRRDAPRDLPTQQQPKLSPAQAHEACALLAEGKSLRQVGEHFGVSYSAIWRQVQRERAASEAGEKGGGA